MKADGDIGVISVQEFGQTGIGPDTKIHIFRVGVVSTDNEHYP